MSDALVMLEYLIVQRGVRPSGQRILSDGTLLKPADDTPLPGEDDLLEKDRPLRWVEVRKLSTEAVEHLSQTVVSAGFFDLEKRLLINYCKEDPGVAIWVAQVGDQKARVVLYDPKPKRNATIDQIEAALKSVLN